MPLVKLIGEEAGREAWLFLFKDRMKPAPVISHSLPELLVFIFE
jgi:hypothetical protein